MPRTIAVLLQVPDEMPLAKVLRRVVEAKRSAIEDCHECIHNCVEEFEGDSHQERLDDLGAIDVVGIMEEDDE